MSLNGAVTQSQAKAVVTVAAIRTTKESAVQEEKHDASVSLQSLKRMCNLEEDEFSLVLLRCRGSCPKEHKQGLNS